jgi:hypothetical protein
LASSSLVIISVLHIYEQILISVAETGAIGGTAQKIGGPLAKDGIIGKQFTSDGAIGGTVQNNMGGEKKA